jgi:hypothetical protein
MDELLQLIDYVPRLLLEILAPHLAEAVDRMPTQSIVAAKELNFANLVAFSLLFMLIPILGIANHYLKKHKTN